MRLAEQVEERSPAGRSDPDVPGIIDVQAGDGVEGEVAAT